MKTDRDFNKEEAPVELNTEKVNDHPTDRTADSGRVPEAAADLSREESRAPEPSEAPESQVEEPQGDPIEYIKRMLESKSTAKQTTFKHLTEAFNLLCSDSKRIIQELKNKAHPADADVTLYFKNISKHEFHVKLAGDLLIFVMHTNIITFDDESELMKEDYIRQNPVNRYFGQINIYNFMYDSLRYNRGNDPGYLIGRLMINHEDRFFMDGEKAFTSLYGRISNEPITDPILQNIVKLSLQIAIKNDLMALPYSKVRSITLNQKNEHSIELGGGQKIGFQMSYQNRVES
jgi:hypothetical protein